MIAPPYSRTVADVVAEARRVVAAAQAAGVAIRLLGGTAVAVTSSPRGVLSREIKDIDIVIPRGAQSAVERVLAAEGYRPSERFNLARGDRRMLFHDEAHGRQLDVFVGEFAMCHRLDLTTRLGGPGPALALSDLLLTKLQTVELNRKDLLDVCAVLVAHEVAEGGDEAAAIDGRRVATVCAADWGWHRTVGMNLARVEELVGDVGLGGAEDDRVRAGVAGLRRRIDAEPKSGRWRRRARIGDRRRWYDQPEEVE